MSDCHPVWNVLPREGRRLLAGLLAVLVLQSTCTAGFWNPVFKMSQQGDKLTVSFLKEYPNASFYKIQLTCLFKVLFRKNITRSQVGAPININIGESRGKPLRIRVTAFSSTWKMLDIPVETKLLVKKPMPTTTPEPTTKVLPPSPEAKVPFTLITTVVVIVAIIGIASLAVCLLRRYRRVVVIQENDDETSLIPTNQRNGNSDDPPEPRSLTEPAGPDPVMLRMHPIYLPGADSVHVVESFQKLLRAHAQVDARPYSSLDVSDDIRSKGRLWVEEQMRLPSLLFLSPGLTLYAVTEPAKDNYNVVQPALALLRERQDYSNVFTVDIRVEEEMPLNNVAAAAVESRADVGGVSLSRRPCHLGALARRGADGMLQLKDFETLVRCLHAGKFPHKQMRNWENCRITQDLLRKIQGLQTEGDGSVAIPIEEAVCECRTNEEAGVPLLNGEANV